MINALIEAVLAGGIVAVIFYFSLRKYLKKPLVDTPTGKHTRGMIMGGIIAVPLIVAFFTYFYGPFFLKRS